ncbi:hypothetical protein AAC387_Pa06g0160 [Persea americana]
MKPPSFVASRTRSRKPLTSPSDSVLKNRIGTDTVLRDHRSSKRLAGGRVRAGDCVPPHESELCDFVIVDEEVKDREERVSAAEGPVAKKTRSRLGLQNDLLNAGDSALSGQESVTGGSNSDGSGFVDGEKKRKRGGLDGDGTDMVRVSSEKLGFDKRRMGECVRVEDEEITKLGKEDSFDSVILNEATDSAGSCVALRTRSRKGLEKEVENPVHVCLDETQSSNDGNTTTTSSFRGNGASAGEEESCSYSNGGKEEEIIGASLIRKTYSGLSLLVPVGKGSSDEVDHNPIGVATRTRAHCPSQPKRHVGTNIGSISNPYKIDIDYSSDDGDADTHVDGSNGKTKGGVDLEPDSSSNTNDEDDDDDEEQGDDDDTVNGGGRVEEAAQGNEQEGQPKSGMKRKRISAPKKDFFYKTIVNTIFKEKDGFSREPASPKVTHPKIEKPQPLIFSFEDTVSKLENSDMEKEENDLWTELNVTMSFDNIGSFSSAKVTDEGTKTGEFEIDASTLCCQGKHQFILDEQIGVVCRFCTFVKLEIKYILPSLEKNVWENSGKKRFYGEGVSFMGGFPYQNTNGDREGSVDLSEGTVWDIVPGIKNTMYPHQQEGFEFMWKNLAGSISFEELKKPANPDDLGGCVISHAPGTGKTRLTIVFLQTFMEVFPDCRPVILAPRSIVLTWEREFKKWEVGIPLHILNKKDFSGREDSTLLQMARMYNIRGANWVRLVKLYSWDKGKSILVLSYSLFERIVEKTYANDMEAQIRKILVEKPGLLILDEGHTPRNEHSLIWKALEKMKTERRIILSGTPFQNNFTELYNTLWLVRPKFADKLSSAEFCGSKSKTVSDDVWKALPERREARGRWASLTNSIGKTTDDRLKVLRSVINPFVHVHKGSILNSLPGLKDCLVYLHPPPRQKCILESIQKIATGTHFLQEYNVSMVSVHPSLLKECSLSHDEKTAVDQHLSDEHSLEELRLTPAEGVKTRFVVELIRLSEALNEKVLVFSQYVQPLSFIKKMLASCFQWTEGKEVLQMDGSVTIKQRQSSIDSFNDPSSGVKVLLASTKACGEGISLIGASRLVLLDVVWNPSVERQAVSRVYRIGQKKMVYTYHLITSGTLERDKHHRQVEKEWLSEMIFSSGDVEGAQKQSSLKISEDRILQEMVGHDELKHIFEKILYQPKKSNLVEALEPTPLH